MFALALALLNCRHNQAPPARERAAPLPRSSTELSRGWSFRQAEASSEKAWTATVPGTVHTDLLDNGQIPDPFVGTHERELQWIAERAWVYETRFAVESALLQRERIELVFEGLDTFADVSLNGSLVLRADNMFRQWRVDVKPQLRLGENTLVVHFDSALARGRAAHDRLGYGLPASNDLGNPKLSMFVRKAPYHFGWDWGPRLVTSGIWRPVRLEAWDRARISDVHVVQKSLNDERAELSVLATIDAIGESSARLELLLDGAQPVGERDVQLRAGANRVQVDLHIERPERWWPNGLGQARLYTFEARLLAAGQALDVRSVRVGLRTLRVEHASDEGGKSLRVFVNDAPVFMKGANYIPQDSFLPRVDAGRYQRLLASVQAANMNMLRVWGGGVYEDERFYALCDELGILVWQDFMFACSMYPSDPAFLASVEAEARYNVRRLRNHPSLALWAGNNEIEWAWRDWGWQGQYDDAQRAAIGGGNRHIFEEILPRVVAEEDPGRFYTRSSPSANDDRAAPNQPGFGDQHYWGVWHVGEPYEKYADNVSRFMSEYGFQGLPELATIARYAAPAEQYVGSEVLRAHQRHDRGDQLIEQYLQRDFRQPKDFASYVYVSQVLQATVIQFAAEAHRRAMPYNGGSLYWQLNDVWPGVSWSSIDYFGRWKALHHFARRFFAPVLVSSFEQDGVLGVYGVSDRPRDSTGVLELSLLDFDGQVLWRSSRELVLAGNRSHLLFEAPVARLLEARDPRRVVLSAELREGGQRLARSLHYFAKTKDLDLPEPGLELERTASGRERAELRIIARRLARAVRLSSSVDGVSFSDNFFDLLPGESLAVTQHGAPDAAVEVRSIRDTYRAD